MSKVPLAHFQFGFDISAAGGASQARRARVKMDSMPPSSEGRDFVHVRAPRAHGNINENMEKQTQNKNDTSYRVVLAARARLPPGWVAHVPTVLGDRQPHIPTVLGDRQPHAPRSHVPRVLRGDPQRSEGCLSTHNILRKMYSPKRYSPLTRLEHLTMRCLA